MSADSSEMPPTMSLLRWEGLEAALRFISLEVAFPCRGVRRVALLKPRGHWDK